MRIRQDLCIALVLAVIGSGFTRPSLARSDSDEGLAAVERAMEESRLPPDQVATVRSLINEAQALQRAGDEDGAAAAMAQASTILRIS